MAIMGLNGRQLTTLIVIISGSFIGLLNGTLVTPTLPTIMAEMNVDASTVQWLTTGFTLVNAIMIPITGYLTDKYSTRTLFIAGMILFALGSAIVAFSPFFTLILIGRMVQAAGAGIMMPLTMNTLMLTFPIEKRGQALGLFGIVIAFAPAIGPTVSGLVIDHFDWRYLFLAVTLLALIDMAAGIVVLDKETKRASDNLSLDKPSLLLSCAGFGSVLYGFSSIGSHGFSIISFAFTAVGAVLLVIFFRRQMKLEQPMLKVSILANRRFTIATIVGMVIQAAIMANSVLIPVFVQDLLGYSATVSGLIMMPGAIMSGVMGPFVGKIYDKRGARKLGIVGTVGLALATTPFVFFGDSVTPAILCLAFFMRSVALSLVNMPITTWGMNALDNSVINHGNALNNTLRQVAGSFGTALVVSVYSMVQNASLSSMDVQHAGIVGFNVSFAVQALICAVAAVLTIVFVKDKAEDARNADPNNVHRGILEGIIKTDVFYLTVDNTVEDAVRLFIDKEISAAPIVDADMNAKGIISDGDLIRALSKRNQSYMDPIAMIITPAANSSFDNLLHEVMTANVCSIATMNLITIDAHSSFDQVCRILGDNHLKKAPVVENGKLVGVINRSDVTMQAMRFYMERTYL